jgi:peptidoglycan/xylan/chitin deacetylase (PgdA/CDA1 family)
MRLPIAMFHHISNAPEFAGFGGWRIHRSTFTRFLDVLEQNDYQTLDFHDLKSGTFPSRKAVILTFDDCPRHLFDFAIPELIRRGFKASFYIPTNFIGKYNEWDVAEGRPRVELMNESEIRELDSLGMEIGGHSHRHIKLGEIKDPGELRDEITLCKYLLESIVKKPVLSFSYPYASVPEHHSKMLSTAGYYYGLSIYQPRQDNFALRRFGCYDIDTIGRFKIKLSNPYKWYRSLTDSILNH